MKIQPIDFNEEAPYEPVKPVVVKSRLKRLFEQFPSVLRTSSLEKCGVASGGGGAEEIRLNKAGSAEEIRLNKAGSAEFDPSSVCLDTMVKNYIEETNEKQSVAARNGRHGCNCFNGNFSDDSDDELDSNSHIVDPFLSSSIDASENLKSLVLCASVSERNLLADTAKIVEKIKICKLKNDNSRNIIVDGLKALGYNTSICKSRWEKCRSYPGGEYEYVDVIAEDERLIIDIDFRSEFEVALATKTYRKILQTLPLIFVGNSDRLQRIVSVVSESAKQSLKKKGMPVPPWRGAEYMKGKWLSPYTRTSICTDCLKVEESKEETKEWELPEIKPKSSLTGVKIVTGLSSLVAKP